MALRSYEYDTLNLSQLTLSPADDVIIRARRVYVDANIRLPGSTLAVYANEVVGQQGKIDLSGGAPPTNFAPGQRATDGTSIGQGGAQGRNGSPGQPGGSLRIYARIITGTLSIDLRGGDGGRGEDGGNGAAGAPGPGGGPNAPGGTGGPAARAALRDYPESADRAACLRSGQLRSCQQGWPLCSRARLSRAGRVHLRPSPEGPGRAVPGGMAVLKDTMNWHVVRRTAKERPAPHIGCKPAGCLKVPQVLLHLSPRPPRGQAGSPVGLKLEI